jgi:hypothetical protein
VKQQFILRQFIASNTDVEIVVGVFISNMKKGEESKIVERHREMECVRGRALQGEVQSVGNKMNR